MIVEIYSYEVMIGGRRNEMSADEEEGREGGRRTGGFAVVARVNGDVRIYSLRSESVGPREGDDFDVDTCTYVWRGLFPCQPCFK